MQQGGGSLSQPPIAVEEASPISSRPPATASLERFDHQPENFSDIDDLDRGGASGSGNRWPRQETLALLQIRAEMDAAFRDATVKGPLWEAVSRKMAEMGFKRSAKKCKEKFENVDKYYKRTKDGRAGRPDGKTYRFFTELEALHTSASTIGFSSPTPISSARFLPSSISSSATMQTDVFPSTELEFPSNGSSSSSETEDDDTDLEAPESSRKRKRGGSSGSQKMEFFEGLVKQVMQKQEAMQQKFLEAIEKREQDRLIREDVWRRQEMARLGREHEIMAQERAISASRDASILSFLQKVTGQAVHLPPLPQPQPYPRPLAQSTAQAVVPEVQAGGDGPSPSRWPKVEVLALIRLRSELETRYQESGPKGPLWEEISAGMQRLGYKRNPKRCKEKWENINKYFKKVQESNKTRPEDAKTCPYFQELDALYRKRIIGGGDGGGGTGSVGGGGLRAQLQLTADAPNTTTVVGHSGDQESKCAESKPEAAVIPQKQLGFINRQGSIHHQNPTLNFTAHEVPGQEPNNGDLEDDYADGEEAEDDEDERKMGYKIEFQQRRNNKAGGGNKAAAVFLAVVQ